jgi:hypothetical protein
MFEEFNFERFNGVNKKPSKGGLTVRNGGINILEINFPDYARVDIYTDKSNNAIKIIEGDSLKVFHKNKGRGDKIGRVISAKSLLSAKLVEIGHYKYVGNNVFVLDELYINKKVNQSGEE